MTGYVNSIQSLGAVDGPGVRYVVFMQGCPLRCVYCHNPDTWLTQGGEAYTADELTRKALRFRPYWRNGGGVTVTGGEALFPRIDMAKELEALEEIHQKALAAAAGPKEEPLPEPLPPVDFDTFCKVEMTVVKVLSCEKVKKSDKLLKFQLDDGTGTPRQILSGIAKYYQPEELLGKTLVAVTNLPPRKMMGQESCGMILSAERGETLKLVMLDDSVPAGARLV